MVLLEDLPDDLVFSCVASSLHICVLLGACNTLLAARLQRSSKSRGLRLVASGVQQAWKIEVQLHGRFRIGDLVLTSSIWPFKKWTGVTEWTALFTSFLKLHTIRVNPEHAGEVTAIYTVHASDSDEFRVVKNDLLGMRARERLKIIARPIL
jgi:hypothetical protein